jgi:hypothetical protein
VRGSRKAAPRPSCSILRASTWAPTWSSHPSLFVTSRAGLPGSSPNVSAALGLGIRRRPDGEELARGASNLFTGLDSSTRTVGSWPGMLCRVLARLSRVLDLARLFDLRDRHPDRMIAASIVLYVGLGIILAITV